MSDLSETAIFLSYQGVTGESFLPADTVPAGPGPDWSPLLSCTLTASVNVQGRAIKASLSASTVDLGGEAPPIVISKRTDGATIGLMREMLAGTKLSNATIVFTRTDSGMPTEYLRYNLEGCSIVGFEMQGAGEDRATEEFKILYRRMTIIAFAGTHGAKGAQSSAFLANGA